MGIGRNGIIGDHVIVESLSIHPTYLIELALEMNTDTGEQKSKPFS